MIATDPRDVLVKALREYRAFGFLSGETLVEAEAALKATEHSAFTFAPFRLEVAQQPGTCRWCGCTEDRACEGGCAWVNYEQTLCSACEHFNGLISNRTGRLELLRLLQERVQQPRPTTPGAEWLIYNANNGQFWGPNGGGYFGLWGAGLYTKAEAERIVSGQGSERRDRMHHVSEYCDQIVNMRGAYERLTQALGDSGRL